MKNIFKSKISTLLGVIVFVAVIGLSLSGCMSMAMGMVKSQIKDYGIYDNSVPLDQQCELRFMFVNIKSFNGKSVAWGGKANNMGRIKVPAGTNTFVFDWLQELTKLSSVDYNAVRGTTTYAFTTTTSSLNNITIPSAEMLAGHNYFIGGGKGIDGQLRIWLLDMTSMPSDVYGDIVAKAPKVSKTPTKLEGKWKNSFGEVFEFTGNTWIQMEPPMTASNTGPNEIWLKGTFEDADGTLMLYATDTSLNGKKWFDMSFMKQAYIWKYSFNEGNLSMELPWVMPATKYIKQ